MSFEAFKKVHLELSSECQAACPACSRVYDYSRHIKNRKEDSAWNLKALRKVFSKELLSELDELFLCGNYGDPLAFNDLSLWFEEIYSINPRLFTMIHTNGGLGKASTWGHLGKTLKYFGHEIKFSLDGLEDTNSLYRRGVNWNQALNNAKLFIENGGKATWKFLEFTHNKHQIEKARKLANDLGFCHFEVRKPYGDHDGLIHLPKGSDLNPNLQTDFSKLSEKELNQELFKSHDQTKEINCQAIEEKMIYIDCDQRVWPCCWLAQDGDHRTRTIKREHFYRKVYEAGIPQDFNHLNTNSLEEILFHPFFQEMLPSSWKKESLISLSYFPTCFETCGKCSS